MKIDLSSVIDAVNSSAANLQVALNHGLVEATRYVRDVWVSAVSGNVLPGMNKAIHDEVYAKSLTTGESMSFPTPYEAIIAPIGYDVNRIENGYPAFDMKPGLLSGPKSRETADGRGRYNTVPFRHYTPSGGGQSAIALRMQMPTDIFKQAQKLTRSTVGTDGRIKWGTSLETDRLPAVSWYGNEHSASIYQGMHKVGEPYQTRYMTFRRVSTYRESIGKDGRVKRDQYGNVKMIGSKPESWWHPSQAPNPVIQAVMDYCMPQVEANLLNIMKKNM